MISRPGSENRFKARLYCCDLEDLAEACSLNARALVEPNEQPVARLLNELAEKCIMVASFLRERIESKLFTRSNNGRYETD